MISPSRLRAERSEESAEERRSDIASTWQLAHFARLLLQPSPNSHGLPLWDCNAKRCGWGVGGVTSGKKRKKGGLMF